MLKLNPFDIISRNLGFFRYIHDPFNVFDEIIIRYQSPLPILSVNIICRSYSSVYEKNSVYDPLQLCSGKSIDKYTGLTALDFVFMFPLLCGTMAEHKGKDDLPFDLNDIMHGDVKGFILSLSNELGIADWWPMWPDGTPKLPKHHITNTSAYHDFLNEAVRVVEDGAGCEDVSSDDSEVDSEDDDEEGEE